MRALLLIVPVLAGACGPDVGFGVALTIRAGDALAPAQLATIASLDFVASGDESFARPYVFDRPAFVDRQEQVIYRPLPATRNLELSIVARDPSAAAVALGTTGGLVLRADATTEALVVLQPDDALDLGVDGGSDALDADVPPDLAPPSSRFSEALFVPSGAALNYQLIATGDFDGDQRPDVVVANQMIDLVVFRQQDVWPQPKTLHAAASASGQVTGLAVYREPGATVDSIASFDSQGRVCWRSGGPGGLPVEADACVTAFTLDPALLFAADLTGDGWPDLLAVGVSGQRQLLTGSSAGFSPGSVQSGPTCGGLNLQVTHVDGDPYVDLLGTNGYRVCAQLGSATPGSFGAPVLSGPTTTATMLPIARDGAGRVTKVAVGSGIDLEVYDLSTGGVVQAPVKLLTDLDAAFTDLDAADLDGDGILDLLANGSSLRVLLGDAQGGFKLMGTYASPARPTRVGRFTGDSQLDLVHVAGSLRGIDILRGLGGGRYRGAARVGPGALQVAVADVDGDQARDDIVVGGYLRAVNGVGAYAGPGASRVWPDVVTTPVLSYDELVTGDLDGDQRADAISGSYPQVTYGFGDGTGSFALSRTTMPMVTKALTTGDLDGDGKADLVVATYPTGFGVYLGSASRVLAQKGGPYLGGAYVGGARIGRLDGDVTPDLVVLEQSSSGLRVFLGAGDGTFAETAESYTVGASAVALAVGDFNGDARMDVAAGTTSGAIVLLLGRGDGRFDAGPSQQTIGGINSLAAADFNRDGFDDLVVGSQSDPELGVRVFDGRSDGLAPAARFNLAGYAYRVTVGDVDDDGRVDIVAASNGVNVLYNETP